MNSQFDDQFQALISKYTELLVGESTDDLQAKVTKWALYSHIAKSMPALINHWNAEFPSAKSDIKNMMMEIKELNAQHRNQSNKKLE
ncbi:MULTISPECIES: DUF2573 family protein [Bacillus]|uniref:DUF2573 family protein n=1 Tax=Bacillus TaxID=1386 RepID=UPI0002E40589|nr:MULTISPECIES: DUF2573 family protein [Bacillus]